MIRRYWIPALLAMIISILVDVLFPGGEGQEGFVWEHIPGFFLFFGLLGCLGLVYFAKALGNHFLHRKDDYYE
jgi:hypothetical protein